MPKIKGIKQKTMWAVFAPDGYLQVRTISDTKKEAESLTAKGSGFGFGPYAAAGFTSNKILVDIKIL